MKPANNLLGRSPFLMVAKWDGHEIWIWDDVVSGATLYAVDGDVKGLLYSGNKNASEEE